MPGRASTTCTPHSIAPSQRLRPDSSPHLSSELDEAHDYKNLQTISNIRDAAIDGSQRASDLHMKLEWLRDRHGDRVATMATATPIANSITEAHVMTRYLRPDLLETAGIEDFDAWAATFGQTVSEIEVAPTGGGDYRMHTRFARFQNVPEMLRLWHVFADVATSRNSGDPRDIVGVDPLLRGRSPARGERGGGAFSPEGLEVCDVRFEHLLRSLAIKRRPMPRDDGL